jgi:transcriptional regulator with XRE-family HTH domain
MSGQAFRAQRPLNPVFTPEYQAVRDILIAARERVGLAQRGLSVQLGRAPPHISELERGQRPVDVLLFYDMALAFGVDPRELFSEIADAVDAARCSAARDRP